MRHSLKILILLFLNGMPSASFSDVNKIVLAVQPGGENTVILHGPPGAISNRPYSISEADMSKAMSQMREAQMRSIRVKLEAMTEPESIALFARYRRALYDALLAEGFTEEQALEIVARLGLPGGY